MKFVFVSNFLNPHQYPLACELYRQTGGSYRFVEMERMPDEFYKSGYPDYGALPWLIRAWQSSEELRRAMECAADADTLMYGSAYLPEIIKRRLADNKLTLKYSERWLKRGWLNALSPAIRKTVLFYHRFGHGKPYYLMGASAFTAADAMHLGTFKDKAFRWGYFPQVSGLIDDEENFICFQNRSIFRIMAVCRMIDWKRPLMMVRVAKALREAGISSVLDMFGSGPMLDVVRREVSALGLENMVLLHGSTPNGQIHDEMRKHHCVITTSSRREGWGAVVNEAMGNGCVVVGSSKIGSVPYLIEDGVNGLIFRDGNQEDLNSKVLDLARNLDKCELMARAARKSMQTVWSPAEAARRVLKLAEELQSGRPSPFTDGPCSPAPII